MCNCKRGTYVIFSLEKEDVRLLNQRIDQDLNREIRLL